MRGQKRTADIIAHFLKIPARHFYDDALSDWRCEMFADDMRETGRKARRSDVEGECVTRCVIIWRSGLAATNKVKSSRSEAVTLVLFQMNSWGGIGRSLLLTV